MKTMDYGHKGYLTLRAGDVVSVVGKLNDFGSRHRRRLETGIWYYPSECHMFSRKGSSVAVSVGVARRPYVEKGCVGVILVVNRGGVLLTTKIS